MSIKNNKKRYIDLYLYNSIKSVLIEKYNLTEDVFELGKLMDLDIVMLFYNSLLKKKKNKEDIINAFMGLYGNFYARKYLETKNIHPVNEYGNLRDINGKALKVDLAYTENKELTLCEVKCMVQIIGDIDHYLYFDYNKDIKCNKKKYESIKENLLKQLTELKRHTKNVKLIIFEGCFIDNTMLSYLEKIGLTKEDIIEVPANVLTLENNIKTMVLEIFDLDFKAKRKLINNTFKKK